MQRGACASVFLGLGLLAAASAACRSRSSPPAEASPPPAVAPAQPPPAVAPSQLPPIAPLSVRADRSTELAGGLTWRALELDRGPSPMTVWIYRRAALRAKAPVILIGAAGTPLIFGMGLGAGDQPEHLPWAQLGYVVVAYSLDGDVVNREEPAELQRGVHAFFLARAGLDNARAALALALAEEPLADAARVFAVGHSSAATVALRVGAELPEVKGIVAFNGVSDVETRTAELSELVQLSSPQGMPQLRGSSPLRHLAQLRSKPVFLFHSEDDSVVPVAETRLLAARLAPLAPPSEVVIVPTGDHYDAMLTQGIPAAMLWLDELASPEPR